MVDVRQNDQVCDMRAVVKNLIQDSSPESYKRVKSQYKDIFCKSNFKIRNTHWVLLFGSNESEALEAPNNILKTLVGDDWEVRRKNLYKRLQKTILDKNNFSIDLSNVPAAFSLSEFNILSQQRKVWVPAMILDQEQIPPVINVTIALAIEACRRGRGLPLWVRKDRNSQSKIPDILLVEFPWTQDSTQAFLSTSYAHKRDSLCANNRLRVNDDVVLPFCLDFDGIDRKDNESARICHAMLDNHVTKAAISIPGAAYVGWINDMTRSGLETKSGVRDYYLLTVEEKRRHRAKDVATMYDIMMEMWDNARGNIVSYDDVVRYMQQHKSAENESNIVTTKIIAKTQKIKETMPIRKKQAKRP